MATTINTQYGTSDHYSDKKGKAYFAYQNALAAKGGKLDARKFDGYIKPTDRVLDFGCGGGWLLGSMTCAAKVGVELNEHAHPVAEANGLKVYRQINDVVERDFDVITSHHCLEHVPYPIEALRSLKDLLAPGGKLILCLPIDDWRTQQDFTGKDIDHHLHTWNPRLMANTMVEAGYEPVESKILTHAWFPRWNKVVDTMPRPLFDFFCVLWSIKQKQRQLFAVARKA